jgi:hypothetical protein
MDALAEDCAFVRVVHSLQEATDAYREAYSQQRLGAVTEVGGHDV